MNEDSVTIDDEDFGLSTGPVDDNTFNKDDICDGVMNYAAGMEITNPEALVTQAVDATLRYVVEWMSNTGYAAKAEILESIGDVA